MAFNVNELRSELTGGGARPSLFQVVITNPVTNLAINKTPFMVKASSLPAASLGTIEVPYFGRKIKVAGDRTFAEWSVTVMNDEDFLVRQAMEEWSNGINQFVNNTTGLTAPNDYKSTQAQVTQFSKTGAALRTYNFNGIFPSEISDITVDWETTDAIEEFTVTFQYDWWTVSGITGTITGT